MTSFRYFASVTLLSIAVQATAAGDLPDEVTINGCLLYTSDAADE